MGDGDRVQLAVGGLDVRGGQRGQVLRGRLLAEADHPDVPDRAGPLEQGPGEPAVAELVDPARPARLGEDGAEHVERGRLEPVPRLLREQVGDADQRIG
jgi:hypothetical protein